ncbi:MAG: DNA/RNA nuclease SfsA [Aquificae bacterium]|nr:DNA/RNA nuclease SfsA [Aquificota bacterium]
MLFDLKKLGRLEEAYFVERPNRFVGICRVGSGEYRCHIADTGRLKEILTEGRKLLVVKNRPEMKTDYRVIGALMEEGWVLLNTSLHSRIGREAIKRGVLGFKPKEVRSEFPYGDSRMDYLVDGRVLVEMKGSNLLKGNCCVFPDAPTERGRKHLLKLVDSLRKGYKPYIMMMGLRECDCFRTNDDLDPEFGRVFREALKEGVGFAGFKVGINDRLQVVLKGKMDLCGEGI